MKKAFWYFLGVVAFAVDGGELLSDDTNYSQYLLLSCVRDALDYEKHRVLQRKRRTDA